MNATRRRFSTEHFHEFKRPCSEIFELACPVREDEWLTGWRELREIIYTESGFAESGCVFKTKAMPHLMGPATWMNNVYDPPDRIQYSAVNENLVYQIEWVLTPADQGCEMVLRRRWTALTPQAEDFLGKMSEQADSKPPESFQYDRTVPRPQITGCPILA